MVADLNNPVSVLEHSDRKSNSKQNIYMSLYGPHTHAERSPWSNTLNVLSRAHGIPQVRARNS